MYFQPHLFWGIKQNITIQLKAYRLLTTTFASWCKLKLFGLLKVKRISHMDRQGLTPHWSRILANKRVQLLFAQNNKLKQEWEIDMQGEKASDRSTLSGQGATYKKGDTARASLKVYTSSWSPLKIASFFSVQEYVFTPGSQKVKAMHQTFKPENMTMLLT